MVSQVAAVVLMLTALPGLPEAGTAAPEVELVLKPVAVVNGEEIRLRDICETRDWRLPDERLLDHVLGSAPAPGVVVVWSRQDIAERLRRALGEVRVRFAGAQAVYITLDVDRITPEQIEAVAAEWLESQLPSAVLMRTLRPRVLMDRPVFVPRHLGEPRLAVDGRGLSAEPRGRIRVDVLLFAGRHKLRTIPVYFETPDARGQENVGHTRPATFESLSRQEQPQLLVERRQPVNIRIRLGTLTVIARGEALEPGREGQFIRVRNTRSGKVLTARVIDSQTVEIPF